MQNLEGQNIPNVSLKVCDNGQTYETDSNSLFENKKTVFFAIVGAFTPTCTKEHLPQYEEYADNFKDLGIDQIVCLTVNDPFVVSKWSEDEQINAIKIIADGNGEFTREMGMLKDFRNLGIGERSWRYSMLIEDGVIQKMFIEDEQTNTGLRVSDAHTMMKYLSPEFKNKGKAVVVVKEGCPYSNERKKIRRE